MEGNRAGVQLGNISKYRDELFGISMILIIFFHFCGPHVGHYSEEVSTSIILTFERRFEMYVGSVGVEIFVFLSGMQMISNQQSRL